MIRTVALSRGLDALARELEALGYVCVSLGEGYVSADAIIYSGKQLPGYAGRQALMINASNKSVEDIVRMLKTRVYSPLF